MENKACDDSFVLHIAVKTNVSKGFVFTAIWRTKVCDDSFVPHIAVNTNAYERFVFTAISSTNQITQEMSTSLVEFQAKIILNNR